MQGETASADIKAVESYSEALAMIIDKGGYTKQQFFRVDTTIFYLKMLTRIFIAWSQYLASRSKLTILLGVNAADFQ